MVLFGVYSVFPTHHLTPSFSLCCADSLYSYMCFMLPLATMKRSRVELPTMIANLWGFFNSLTFGFIYFKDPSLTTQNFGIILYTSSSIIRKNVCIPYNYEVSLFVCRNTSCHCSVFHIGVASSVSL